MKHQRRPRYLVGAARPARYGQWARVSRAYQLRDRPSAGVSGAWARSGGRGDGARAAGRSDRPRHAPEHAQPPLSPAGRAHRRAKGPGSARLPLVVGPGCTYSKRLPPQPVAPQRTR